MNDKKISPEEFDRIEIYLNNTMNDQERSEFDESIKNNESLAQKVGELKVLFQAVEEQSLRDKLNIFHKETSQKEKIGLSVRLYKQFALAASIVIIMAIGILLLTGQKNQNEKLFAEYFKPDPGLITPMSSTSNYEFYRGMVDYKQAKYNEAIDRWHVLYKNKPNNDTLNFYLGVAYLALDDRANAVTFLSKAATYSGSKFINEAWYYLGLANLKEGNLEKSMHSLAKSKIENSKLLLRKIKEIK